VAVVGAGPAGLTAAHDLALLGYPTTIFEALPVVGGMMYTGIPEYRFPKSLIQHDAQAIFELGVELKTNTSVGKDIPLAALRDEGYRATFLAVGAHKGLRMEIPGEDLKGVQLGVPFLREHNLGNRVEVGKHMTVVGGGNVAVDAARCCLRLGVETVKILYRRTREEMPAIEEEIEAALEEGVEIEYLCAPVEILGEGGSVRGIRCIRMQSGEPDASGRRRPVPIPGSEHDVSCDGVIVAIGQAWDPSFLGEDPGLEVVKGILKADRVTLETNLPGVFAGGDAATGPRSVVEAIGEGHEAAISIDRYLRGQDLREGRPRPKGEPSPFPEGRSFEVTPRQPAEKIPADESRGSWKEVEITFTEQQAVEEAKRCLNCGICCECFECVKACQADAVDHEMEPQVVELTVGSVIAAPGFECFDANLKGEYGYGRYRNVVTSLEFERILSASGPYQGHILRPWDRKEPKRIAWIQCVGSRDVTCGKDYCSSVCCMYATKEAIMAVDHVQGLEATVFYNDMRAFGKGFEGYFESAKDNYGVRFVRGIVSTVKEMQKSKNMKVRYLSDDEDVKEEEFDLIVLSVGLSPTEKTRVLAERLGISLNAFGFCESDDFSANQTSTPGIFVAGAYEAPMDIPETVMGASSGASLASQLLSEARGSLVREKSYPPERDVEGEEPRIGVFICRCGTNIARVVGVSEVVDYARSLPGVVHAEENLYTCSTDTQEGIIRAIDEHGLNRVVVASCTPRTHEPLFQETLCEGGFGTNALGSMQAFQKKPLIKQRTWFGWPLLGPQRSSPLGKPPFRSTKKAWLSEAACQE
jgi:heterodisulfide reductase subunit A-like polyferredoxin